MSSFWEHKIHVHVFSMHLCQCCTFHTNTIPKKMPCANNKGEVAWNTVVDVQYRHYACACSRSHVALQFFIFLFCTFFLLSPLCLCAAHNCRIFNRQGCDMNSAEELLYCVIGLKEKIKILEICRQQFLFWLNKNCFFSCSECEQEM